ncbi:acyl-CoA N-acyltransferase [Epithele typhae]|uniref:acyl-CoA N-acyltransferase n=1 Tax=Epithele typhae TaxID=378194 RepID=UPI002008E994|nr:acyl-CoA N-acyltransferase [Epithele typhae]KAH9920553.1 acyl-CoA N-acyltransferase [Epithele typhae]
MKANEKTMIVHPDVVLVPYMKEHVEVLLLVYVLSALRFTGPQKYHEWMSDPELRELTASEPLTLEEEYEMQRKWRDDDDKLTFIVLAGAGATATQPGPGLATTQPMVGDVNLFLKGSPADDDFEAEVEIMIAEPAHRRKGLAHAALQLLLAYATTALPVPVPRAALVARVAETNAPSIGLLEKLGFAVVRRVEVFGEVEMRYRGPATGGWVAGEVVALP